MNDAEVMRHIRENTPLNRVRAVLSGIIGAAEQAGMQRRCPSPIEMRAAEFRAVNRLLAAMVEHGLAASESPPGSDNGDIGIPISGTGVVSAEAIRAEIAWNRAEEEICRGYAEASTTGGEPDQGR